ncbi:MAG: hypothetical protein ABIQ16_16740 [Polyangiaceae bacterium]
MPRSQAALVAMATLLLVLFALTVRTTAHAETTPEFRVIVHADNPVTSLSREFVADVYLKRTTRWSDGETVHPIDQRIDSEVRKRFSETVLKRSVTAVKRYWQQRIFSGRELPPAELDSDQVVVAYVAKHRGAIGYVSAAVQLDRVKSVAVH